MYLEKPIARIKISESLKLFIIDEREKAGLSATALAKKMGRPQSWIAQIENGRTQTIKNQDLVSIFQFILDVDSNEADEYLENKLEKTKSAETKGKFKIYNRKEDEFFDEVKFKELTDNIVEGFNVGFHQAPEYVFKTLLNFRGNLHADMGFTLGVVSMPFMLLKNVDDKIKKQLFDDIDEVIKKYVNKYAPIDDKDETEI